MNPSIDIVRTESARRIQRCWHAFATDRRHAPDDARALARRLGNLVVDEGDYYASLSEKRVLFYINGASGDPTNGHSAFMIDDAFWHLVIGVRSLMTARGQSNFSRYPIAHRPRNDLYSVICCHDTWSVDTDPHYAAKVRYLVGKGVFFTLREQYAPLFLPAFHAEREQFIASPFSYGFHYNCNTLVRNVLMRILQMAIRKPV